MMRALARKKEAVQEEHFSPASPRRAVRKSYKLSKSRFSYLLVIFLLSYVAVTFSAQFSKLAAMQRSVTSMQREVQELREKNAALREEIRLLQNDTYIEKTAREKLGLVKPGETRVVAVPAGSEVKKIVPPSTAPSTPE